MQSEYANVLRCLYLLLLVFPFYRVFPLCPSYGRFVPFVSLQVPICPVSCTPYTFHGHVCGHLYACSVLNVPSGCTLPCTSPFRLLSLCSSDVFSFFSLSNCMFTLSRSPYINSVCIPQDGERVGEKNAEQRPSSASRWRRRGCTSG